MAKTLTAHQKHLAKMRERDEVWARQFGRTSKYAETLSEGHDSGGQANSTQPQVGDKSAFRQISGNGPLGVIR